ncbi:MAG: orotidine-5'-phosphate decarboxylase [Elusimicrobia bacterium]|nr:orotidine-5'-phosphate decarboxylase [Elusimicrobiota bacterium]
MSTSTELIVALDVSSIAEVEALLFKLRGSVTLFKVGLQLFTAHGKRAVDLVHRAGGRVFLDLKLHDIPQTVAHAVREAQRLGVHSLSVHLSSGRDVLEAAAAVHPRPKLWGVTVLTSLSSSDLEAIHPGASVDPTVERLAALGTRCGIDAVICSGKEVPMLRKALGAEATFVTPGIRPAGSAVNDQKRVLTPGEAAGLGIRYIVVGRPITHDADPLAVAQAILTEIKNAAPRAA